MKRMWTKRNGIPDGFINHLWAWRKANTNYIVTCEIHPQIGGKFKTKPKIRFNPRTYK